MRHSACLRPSVLALLAIAFSSRAAASVITVGPSGSNYTDVQSAVNAAAEGDTILVRAGSYAGFDVGAKSLSIVADPQGSVSITSLVLLHDLAPGQRILLSGLSIGTVNSPPLRATNCAGALRGHALGLQCINAPSFGDGAQLTNCADTAFFGCTFVGAPPLQQGIAGAGLWASGSRIALYDCTSSAGSGYFGYHMGPGGSSIGPTPGGSGCFLVGSSVLLASGCTISGGTGGPGVTGRCFPAAIAGGPGASGGPGMWIDALAEVHALDSLVQGGLGGAGGGAAPSCGAPAGADGPRGPMSVGTFSTLAGTRRKLVSPTHARELNLVPLSLFGQAGDVAWVRIGTTTDWQLALPFQGVQLFGSNARRALLGTLPPSGTLGTSLYFGDLGPGVESKTWHMQGVFRDAAGQTHLGSAAALVVLDSAF